EPWAVPLVTTGTATAFYATHEVLSARAVLEFLVFDPYNPSSIMSCLKTVRGAISSEMYEDLNAAWLEMRDRDAASLDQSAVQALLEWVKMRSHTFRGVTFGTMLRGEEYDFIRLGTHIERAVITPRRVAE